MHSVALFMRQIEKINYLVRQLPIVLFDSLVDRAVAECVLQRLLFDLIKTNLTVHGGLRQNAKITLSTPNKRDL